MIELENISKKIRKKEILTNITHTFEKGKIYGLYGENASGKTMLLRAISGLIIPDSGNVKINNQILHKDISFPPSIGLIIEHMELLPQFSAKDNLKILAKIKKIASEEDIDQSLYSVGLDPSSKMKVRKFSLGMKQKLNIAQATFENPDVILLDEPTNALDEESVKLIYELLEVHKKRGAVIIIATHSKDDLQDLCDTRIRISNGRIKQ